MNAFLMIRLEKLLPFFVFTTAIFQPNYLAKFLLFSYVLFFSYYFIDDLHFMVVLSVFQNISKSKIKYKKCVEKFSIG